MICHPSSSSRIKWPTLVWLLVTNSLILEVISLIVIRIWHLIVYIFISYVSLVIAHLMVRLDTIICVSIRGRCLILWMPLCIMFVVTKCQVILLLIAIDELLSGLKFIAVPSWRNADLNFVKTHILLWYLNVIMTIRTTTERSLVISQVAEWNALIWIVHMIPWELRLLVWIRNLDVWGETIWSLVARYHITMLAIHMRAILVRSLKHSVLGIAFWESRFIVWGSCRMCLKLIVIVWIVYVLIILGILVIDFVKRTCSVLNSLRLLSLMITFPRRIVKVSLRLESLIKVLLSFLQAMVVMMVVDIWWLKNIRKLLNLFINLILVVWLRSCPTLIRNWKVIPLFILQLSSAL